MIHCYEFTLPRLFPNPAISNFFPFPLGLRNSAVQLYVENTDVNTISVNRYEKFLLFWVDFAGLSCFYFTKRGWPFVFTPKQNLLCTQTTQNSLVCLRCVRTGSRCTVTWLPNFLGWVDCLSQGALPTRARSARVELRYYNIINCKSPHDACGVMAFTTAEIQSAHVTSHFMQCVEKVITIVVFLFAFPLSTALITVIDSWLPLEFATSVTLKV